VKNKPFVDKYFAKIDEKNQQIKKDNPKVKLIPISSIRKRYSPLAQLFTEYRQRYPKLALQRVTPDGKKTLVEIYKRAIEKAGALNDIAEIQKQKAKLKITPEPETIIHRIEQQLFFKKIQLASTLNVESDAIDKVEEQIENISKEYTELHRSIEPEDPILKLDGELDQLEKELSADFDLQIAGAKADPELEKFYQEFFADLSKEPGAKRLPPIQEVLKKAPSGSVFSRVNA